jgi:hypothetical protein
MDSSQVIADAQRLAGNYEPLPTPEAKPTIIVVSGLPGTGKTYFSQRLAERLHYVILESDDLRKQLFSRPTYAPSESTYVFRIIHLLIQDLLKKGISLILDATNLTEKYRERLYNIAERADARLVLVNVKAPPELVQKRMKARAGKTGNKSDAGWSVYQQLAETAETITRRHYTVDTSRDITPVIDKIVKEVSR